MEDEKEKYSAMKFDAITMEYNFLLSSQLETQRAFFEKQVSTNIKANNKQNEMQKQT